MDATRSDSVRPSVVQVAHRITITIRLGLLSLYLVLLLSGSVLTSITVTLFFVSPNQANPFADFEAMMPGQPGTIVERYPRTCQLVIPSESNSILCQLSNYDAVSITIGIQKDVIDSFSIKGSDWHFGELVMRWGLPDTIKPIKGLLMAGHPEGAVSVSWSDYYAHAVLAPLSRGYLWNEHTSVWYLYIDSGK